jgi:hypothetical protein
MVRRNTKMQLWFDATMNRPIQSIIGYGKFHPSVAPVHVRNELLIDAQPYRIWSILTKAGEWPDWYSNSRMVRIEGGVSELYLGAHFTWWSFGIYLQCVVEEFLPFERLTWTVDALGWKLILRGCLSKPRPDAVSLRRKHNAVFWRDPRISSCRIGCIFIISCGLTGSRSRGRLMVIDRAF